MKRPDGQTVLALLAAAAIVAGVTAFAHSVRSFPEHERHLQQKRDALKELQRLESDGAAEIAALHAFQSLSAARAVPPAELAESVLDGLRPAVRPRETRPVAAGWTAREVEVSFPDIALADAARFMSEAEKQRPPWRLRECGMLAAENKAGRGSVTLVLETIERQTP